MFLIAQVTSQSCSSMLSHCNVTESHMKHILSQCSRYAVVCCAECSHTGLETSPGLLMARHHQGFLTVGHRQSFSRRGIANAAHGGTSPQLSSRHDITRVSSRRGITRGSSRRGITRAPHDGHHHGSSSHSVTTAPHIGASPSGHQGSSS